jgi:hypothetical protein
MNAFYPPRRRATECAPYLSRQRFGVRRQSDLPRRSMAQAGAATALSKEHDNIWRGKSGVALRFPPQSKTPGGMPHAFKLSHNNPRNPWLEIFSVSPPKLQSNGVNWQVGSGHF